MGQGLIIKDPTPQWLTDPSVTDSTMTKALRWAAQVIGADSPSAQVLGIMSTLVPSAGKAGGLAQKVTEAIKGIKAYHGSPHDFDKFSMEKIGTGEGAQAYGHGLYFAETEATARAYRDNLTQMRVGAAQRQLSQHGGDINAATTAARSEIDRLKSLPNAGSDVARRDAFVARRDAFIAIQEGKLAELKALKDSGSMSKGRMYEVNIKADPESFLDWDKPLSQQPLNIQQALQSAGLSDMGAASAFRVQPTASRKSFKVTQGGYEYGTYRTEAAANQRMQELVASHSDDGGRAYQRLGGNVSYPGVEQNAAASLALREAGIPGIKYLDQGSRAAGKGSRNYVVFDDSIVDILKKYGLLPAAVGTGTAMQPEVK